MKKLLVLIALLPIAALAADEERVVALGGDVTEIVYALDAQSSSWHVTAPVSGHRKRPNYPM